MGIDFIRDDRTGKPWRKRWPAELERLQNEPSLFDLIFPSTERIVSAQLEPGVVMQLGKEVVVQVIRSEIQVFDGISLVARVHQQSADLAECMAEGHGIVRASVDRVSLFGDTIELRIK